MIKRHKNEANNGYIKIKQITDTKKVAKILRPGYILIMIKTTLLLSIYN